MCAESDSSDKASWWVNLFQYFSKIYTETNVGRFGNAEQTKSHWFWKCHPHTHKNPSWEKTLGGTQEPILTKSWGFQSRTTIGVLARLGMPWIEPESGVRESRETKRNLQKKRKKEGRRRKEKNPTGSWNRGMVQGVWRGGEWCPEHSSQASFKTADI